MASRPAPSTSSSRNARSAATRSTDFAPSTSATSRTRRRPLADDESELEVFHRGIEHFLDHRAEPVDFIDEQNVALLEIGEQRREITGLGDDRAGGGTKIHTEFARHDLRQRGLAEAG